MSEVRKRKLELKTIEYEPPEKKLISEADIFIKKLSENQLNTKVTLESQLSHEKEFTKSTELVPLSSYLPGTSSLDSFQSNVKQVEQIEEFLSAGLSERDVELYLGSLNGDAYILQKYKNLETSIMKQRLSEIDKLLERHDKKLIPPPKEEVDKVGIEVGVRSECTKTKLMKFALNNQKLKKKPILPHPLDELKQIEETKFGHLKNKTINPNINKIRRKARKLFNRIKNLHDVDNLFSLYKSKVPRLLNKTSSEVQTKWDMTEKVDETVPVVEKKVYTCKPQNYYTIKNKQIVKLNQAVEAKECDVKKLNLEEIKRMPKFENYNLGSPSKTLYLKNLNNSIKEADLKTLFQNYQQLDVDYRLLKGKMRGQAFVTFPDARSAQRALEEVNGTFVKNKPVVIEFGKGFE